MTDFQQALADDVTLHDFFMTWVPKLFEARRDDFAAASDIDLIVCFKFDDADEIYTFELSAGGAVVEDDEMIDFPAMTVVGSKRHWPRVREAMRPLVEQLDARRAELRQQYRLTEALLADWEKFDLIIDFGVRSEREELKFAITLNDYAEPAGARRFGFSVDLAALQELAAGASTPEEVARSLAIRGDVRAAATFGGMLLKHQSK